MENSEYNIGMFGTFDVENYGDLLFPLIAEIELKKRLGSVNIHKFSYHTKHPSEWPYDVTSITELPRLLSSLDGILIGGGHIIRFDKNIAPNYQPPNNTIHHPTGYWLTPALLALQHGIPVIWNTPGLHGDIPSWAHSLLKLVFENSQYISVRDQFSKDLLTEFAGLNEIKVVPDTAFGISQLESQEIYPLELNEIRKANGLVDPYILIQATNGLEFFLRVIKQHANIFKNIRILALPIGPVHGDKNEILKAVYPGIFCLPKWPHPLMIAELIRNAEAVVGQSFHLAVTALSYGVPVFSTSPLGLGKYKALASFKNLYPLPEIKGVDPHWFISKLGKTQQSAKVIESFNVLALHWDRVARLVREGVVNTQPVFNQFWQSLPQLLETNEMSLAAKDEQLKLVYNSRSWKITGPLRFVKNKFKYFHDK